MRTERSLSGGTGTAPATCSRVALGPLPGAEPAGLGVPAAHRGVGFMETGAPADRAVDGWPARAVSAVDGRGRLYLGRPTPDKTVTSAPPRREPDGIRLDQEDLRLLALLAEGLPVNSVARRVAMSDRTIRRRIRAICEQLGVKTTVQAIVWAARSGLV